ncbi:MAG: SocA family protein [Candidatus Peribacteria bacterium]|nr:SocA family protein [Candidatus Peribacteria bacterium]
MVIAQMEKDHQIQQLDVPYFQYMQQKIIPLVEPDLEVLNGKELAELEYVVNKYGDWNADKISERSHGDMPWKATKKEGDIIHYDFAMYRNGLYSVTVGRDDDEN